MDRDFYSEKFKSAADRIDRKLLSKHHLHIGTGIILNSVFLKLYKLEWCSDPKDPMNARSRIFFSVWVNDKILQEQKIFYNIHALKLRQLKGYAITSRDFAERFRKEFKKFEPGWKNVSTQFGPLTLMEGWKTSNPYDTEEIVLKTARQFLQIDHLVDNTMDLFKL